MMTAKDIKQMALECGACDLIRGAESIADLVALMRTPQGREFCKKHRFPTLEMLRQHKEELVSLNVHVDASEIAVKNVDDIIVAGDTRLYAKYDSADRPFHVMVMHGATADVMSYNYSVCEVTDIDGKVDAFEEGYSIIYVR